MAVYTTIVYHVLYFLVLAIDVTAFFLIVSTVMLVKDVSWLRSFDQAGRALVDTYAAQVDRWWARFSHRSLAPRGKYIVGLLILELIRLVLAGVANLLRWR